MSQVQKNPTPKKKTVFGEKLQKLQNGLGWKMALSLIKAIVTIIFGAILWFALGSFLPQVREALPHFFQIVDAVVHLFDQMCALLVKTFL